MSNVITICRHARKAGQQAQRPDGQCYCDAGAGLSQGHSTTLGLNTDMFTRFRNPKDKRDFVTAGECLPTWHAAHGSLRWPLQVHGTLTVLRMLQAPASVSPLPSVRQLAACCLRLRR